jgi:hypothetical protein
MTMDAVSLPSRDPDGQPVLGPENQFAQQREILSSVDSFNLIPPQYAGNDGLLLEYRKLLPNTISVGGESEKSFRWL